MVGTYLGLGVVVSHSCHAWRILLPAILSATQMGLLPCWALLGQLYALSLAVSAEGADRGSSRPQT